MTGFVLVHGSWHGAWCWERVLPELRRRGHDAVAVDLPLHDASATAESFAEVIGSVIGEPSDTVLVAHSMSGLVAPVLAERRPMRELVLLAALLPRPGASWVEQLGDAFHPTFTGYRNRMVRDGYVTSWRPEDAAELFYHDCDPSDAADAAGRLRPEACRGVFTEKTPLTARPPVPMRYIACAQDRVVSPDWGAEVAKEEYDAQVVVFQSSHSPFWSHPADLAELLTEGHPGG
jgi:pimeloyl-ACP methyl ester carboxylesterase